MRLGKRTKDLVKRLELGEIAIIDHADLDRIAAEDLAVSGVVAVVNVASFSTDRYPNTGPLILARAGIVLVESTGAPLFEKLSNGDVVELEGGDVLLSGQRIAAGGRPSIEELELRLSEQRERIDEAIADFAINTIEHVREESGLLSGEIDLPADPDPLRRPARPDRRPGHRATARICRAERLHPRRQPADHRRRRWRRRGPQGRPRPRRDPRRHGLAPPTAPCAAAPS